MRKKGKREAEKEGDKYTGRVDVVPDTKELQDEKGKLLNPTILSTSSQESMCVGKRVSLPSPKRLKT